jgi:hypothetical protein
LPNTLAFVIQKACDEIDVDALIRTVELSGQANRRLDTADALHDLWDEMANSFHSISQQAGALIAEAQTPIPDAMKETPVDRRVKSRREIYEKKNNEHEGVENKGLLSQLAGLFSWQSKAK